MIKAKEDYMNSKPARKKLRMITMCFLICLVAGAGASVTARGGGDFRGGDFHRGYFHSDGFHRGGFYGYGLSRWFPYSHLWGGFYLGSEWFWGPTVVVESVPYYYYNGEFYTPEGDELVAVRPPVAATTAAPAKNAGSEVASVPANEPVKAPAQSESNADQPKVDAFTVNVPNANGGYTPVRLTKTDKGYIGPQGEYYPSHPTVAELKVLYGK
jgi:hypothetical protein